MSLAITLGVLLGMVVLTAEMIWLGQSKTAAAVGIFLTFLVAVAILRFIRLLAMRALHNKRRRRRP